MAYLLGTGKNREVGGHQTCGLSARYRVEQGGKWTSYLWLIC